MRAFYGEFRCQGSRTRLVGLWQPLGRGRVRFLGLRKLGRLLFVAGHTYMSGTLRRENGRDVLQLAGSRSRFVGRLKAA